MKRFHLRMSRSACLSTVSALLATSGVRADTYVVTTLASTGPGSLADAVATANAHAGGDSIAFAENLKGVIGVTSTMLVNDDLTVLGSTNFSITIDGYEIASVFHVLPPAASFACTDLRFTRCRPAILVEVSGLMLHIDRCSFSDCAASVNFSAGRQGGAITLSSSGVRLNAMITNSTFLRNRSGQGGAFASNGGTQTVINCTFVENSAIALGGAIAVNASTTASEVLRISNCTFTGNMVTGAAANVGGAVFANDTADDAFTCNVAVRNSVLYGNSAVMGPDGFLAPAVLVDDSTGYNLIGEPSGFPTRPSDIIGMAPMLGPLQDNGGLTHTRAPLMGSPLIDHGAADPLVMFDQRGVARPYDFPNIPPAPGGNDTDIGAVEVAPPPCDADINRDGVVNSQDFFEYLSLFFAGC